MIDLYMNTKHKPVFKGGSYVVVKPSVEVFFFFFKVGLNLIAKEFSNRALICVSLNCKIMMRMADLPGSCKG